MIRTIVYAIFAVSMAIATTSCGDATAPQPREDVNVTVHWEHPNPRHFVRDIWMESEVLGYAVGVDGMALRYDGLGWTALDLGTGNDLLAVWGSGPGDVYIGGYNVLHHFDGTTWTDVKPEGQWAFLDIWGASANDVYFGARPSSIWHYDGTGMEPTDLGTTSYVECVHGSSTDDVYAGARALYHFDGTGWQMIPGSEDWYVQSVWANSRDDVWALRNSRIAHFDGAQWADSVAWLPLGDRVFGYSSTEVYGVGRGALHRFDGNEWTILRDLENDVPNLWLESLHVTSPGRVWVGGGGGGGSSGGPGFLEVLEDGKLTAELETVAVGSIYDVCSVPFTDVAYAVGDQAVLERREGRWRRVESQFGGSVKKVALTTALHVLASGSVFRHEDPGWQRLNEPSDDLFADMAPAGTTIWAVSWKGISSVRGYEIERVLDVEGISAIGTSINGEVLAVGNTRDRIPELVICHYNGEAWSVVQTLEQFQPTAVTGHYRNGFLVGGYQRTSPDSRLAVWHVTRDGWVDVTPEGMSWLAALGGNAYFGNVAASRGGLLFRYYDGVWSNIESPFATSQIIGLSRSAGPDVYVFGNHAAIARIERSR